MAGGGPIGGGVQIEGSQNQKTSVALTLMIALFFVFGIITVLNDILIPHFKGIFGLSYVQAMMINLCFFGAYFVMAIPSSTIIEKVGYKKGMLIGLSIVAVGCLLFYPASVLITYWMFLIALFTMASGITLLQVAANAYTSALGDPAKASSRISLAGGVNSFATFVGPMIGATLILDEEKFNTAETAANSKYGLTSNIDTAFEASKNIIGSEKAIAIQDSLVSAMNFNAETEKSVIALGEIHSKTAIIEETTKLVNGDNEVLKEGLLKGLNVSQEVISSSSSVFSKSVEPFLQSLSSVTADVKVLKAGAVQIPYLFLAALVAAILLVIWKTDLPSIIAKSNDNDDDSSSSVIGSALDFAHLKLGALAIFVYVGAEVVIGSLLIDYLKLIKGFGESEAAFYVSLYWGGAMIGRFIGAGLLQKIQAHIGLRFAALGAALFVSISILTTGDISMWSLLVVGLFNSIMWPTIFSLSLSKLGVHTTKGSGILIMGVVGGALIPLVQGLMADSPSFGLQASFWVAVACYAYLVFFAIKGYKMGKISEEIEKEA